MNAPVAIDRREKGNSMTTQLEHDRKETRFKVVPGDKVERAIFDEFAKGSSTPIRVSKSVTDEGAPIYTFIKQAG